MNKLLERERRSSPRIKANLKIGLPGKKSADSIDLSEAGLQFNSVETISSPTVSLQVNFPDKNFEFKINAKLVWRGDLAAGGSSYGLEFVALNEIQKSALRKELIKIQIQKLLNDIKDPDAKKGISIFFSKDILDYINEINKIVSHLSKDDAYSQEIDTKITHLNNQIVLKGYCLEELLSDKKIMQKVMDNFRYLIGVWAYKSPVMKRGFEKPRGYPGDYLMLEAVYDNRPSVSGIGLYFDKYFLDNPYAVAVRYRKDRLNEILENEIQQSKSETMKIFDIACGSCREIKELPHNLFKGKVVTFTCLDWDEEALEFSTQALKDFPENAHFKFAKEDIMKIMKDANLMNSYGNQDLIYSIGLIDYLPDRILKLFMKSFYEILKTGGKLILTHKNREKTFSPLPPAWFCDWKFVPRNKEEVINLFHNCGLGDFSLSTEVDDFNDIFYFSISKI